MRWVVSTAENKSTDGIGNQLFFFTEANISAVIRD